MRVCTCLWGGVFNPIIPVCKTFPDAWNLPPFSNPTASELANGYINFFEPDVYVEAEDGLSNDLNIKKFELSFTVARVSLLDAILQDIGDDVERKGLGLDIFGVYKTLYDREFKFVTRGEKRPVLFEDIAPEDEPFFEAACGGFPSTGQLSPIARAYQDAFAPHVLKATPGNWAKSVREGLRFPLYFTRHELERSGDGVDEPVVFVVDPESPLDLVDLWNLRIFCKRVIPINYRWFTELSELIKEFILANHRAIPRHPQGMMTHTTVEFARSIGEARAQSLVKDGGLDSLPIGSWQFKLWYHRIWSVDREDFVWRPRRLRVRSKARDVDVVLTGEGRERRIRFETLAPEFASTFGNSASGWVNVLRLRDFRSADGLALSLPNDYDPAKTRSMRIGGSIIPSREGLVLIQEYKGHREYLGVLTGREALTNWLSQHSLTAEISSAGRVTEQVLASLSGLRNARILAHRETLLLLDRMAKSVRTYENGMSEEYPDRAAAATEWTTLIARRGQESPLARVTLDEFIAAKVIRLGLSIECSYCTNANWYGLGDLAEDVECTRCLRKFAFPQGRINYKNSPWKFRVVGPFSVPNYADGAYATVLALRVFAECIGSDSSVTYSPGLNLQRGDSRIGEVDFLLWFRRGSWIGESDETLTVFGEAKSFGDRCFQQKDVERLRAVADLFPGSFLVFAALKPSLHDDEKVLIGALARWGRETLDDGRPRAPVIVLTGNELFAEWRLENTWRDLGGQHAQFVGPAYIRLDNLWNLADATQQLYLDLPSRSEELRAQWEAESGGNHEA